MSALAGLRRRLHEPGPLLWAQAMFPEPGLASILGLCGFDFVMLDAEHGVFTLPTLRDCTEALRATSTPVVVRLASSDGPAITQTLDLGVDGVIAPRVESAAEAAAIVRAARYGPDGRRGVSGATRAARYLLDGPVYVAEGDARVAVLVIIESAAGVAAAEEIVAVPGLDGVFIGGDDLSADMGIFGRGSHPDLGAAIERVTAAALGVGLKVVMGAPGTDEAREHALVPCLNDAVMYAAAARQALAAQREALAR